MGFKSQKGTLTKSELVAMIRREHFYRQRFWLYGMSGMIGFIVLMSVYSHFNQNLFPVIESWLPFAGMMFVYSIFYFWFLPSSGYYMKFARRSLLPTQFEISAEFFISESDGGYFVKFPLNAFHKIYVRHNYIALWETPYTFHLVPFRFFSPEDQELVIAEISNSMSANTQQ